MLHKRSAVIGAAAGFAVALSLVAGTSCQRSNSDKKDSTDTPTPSPALPPQSQDELDTALAKVDDVVITVGDFQERINAQSPYIRARYTSLEQKKEFLDNLIRFEVLAKEAFERGFDKDPDVVRTMKQVMIQKLMKDEFENKLSPDSIAEAEMQKFYEEHSNEYNKPEEVRVSAIIVKNKNTAAEVAKQAHGDKGKTNKGFRELVAQYSTDEQTKIRGGDLRYFSAQNPDIPKPVIEAAFSLGKTGDVAGPIAAGNGTHYIIKQTGHRRAVTKSFDDVKRQIQNRIYRDKRTTAQKDFIQDLRTKAKVEVFDKNLAKIRVDTSARSSAGGHGHGAPAFPGDPSAQDDSEAEKDE
jgi:peptidyl-prolyl cis-trans isomerase C